MAKVAHILLLLLSLLQEANALWFGEIIDTFLMVLFNSFFSIVYIFNNKNAVDGLKERSLEVDGLTRWFLERQPVGGMKDGATLVIMLVDAPGHMYSPFSTTRWPDLSDQHGFLLLSPNPASETLFGTKTRGFGSFNVRLKCPGIRSNQDDVAFLSQVIASAIQEHSVDPGKVYITGISNGGFMTYRMLLERSDIVSAGAAFLATLPGEEAENFEIPPPANPSPVFIMTGTKDRKVPYDGGSPGNCCIGGPLRSSTATRDYFINLNGASPMAEEETLPDLDPNDDCRIKSEFYPSNTAPVQYYEMQGVGHEIPLPCGDADGAELAWDFFSQLPQ